MARLPGKPVSWTIPRRPLGAHMSIAGGLDLAIERGAAIGCTAIQIFDKSNNQWAARVLGDDEVARFRKARLRTGIDEVIAHASYLINLCSPDDALYRKSIDAVVLELERCSRLGVDWLVVHPGGHKGEGDEFGIRRMAAAIDEVHRRQEGCSGIAVETTAGQGTILGHTFEQIGAILARVKRSERIGVCLDTCHVFAAGYDLRDPRSYAETMRRFEGEIGLDRLRAVHVNDSKRDLGSRVDRHEHIGRGRLGLQAFRQVMNDPRLWTVPLILETPKDETSYVEDVMNLKTLIGLVEKAAAPGARAASAGGVS
ncbi:MAG TPA: deoxyribonuclease IV [Candidatus Polarisedimenticolia bacterium]|nr:deoxyribonuclease IV [Candidatus Polarisedimenticolia bacterium]